MNNLDTNENSDNIIDDTSAGTADATVVPAEFNGSWEQKGRSITAAAITGMLGVGVVYFNAQSILVTLFALIYTAFYNIKFPENFFDNIETAIYEYKTPILLALVISQYLFMLVPTIWLVKKWHTKNVIKYLRIQYFSIKEVSLAVLITISLLPFCYYISYLIMELFKIPEVFRNLGEGIFTAHNLGEFLVLVFVIAVTPAICEEVFFRGYVQRTFERTLGMKSFLITGFLFGLFHMQPLGLISLSILGILFSFFYYRSKSIFPSSAAHFTNNLIALSMMYFQTTGATAIGDENIPIALVIASMLVAAGLITLYIRVTKLPPVQIKQE